MISYKRASQHSELFQQLFGRSVAEFDALFAEFVVAHDRRLANSTFTRKDATARRRKSGAGRRFKHAPRERLLLTLLWLHAQPTLGLLGRLFDLDKTSAEDNLKDILATLETMDSLALERPEPQRPRIRTTEQLLNFYPEAARVLDG